MLGVHYQTDPAYLFGPSHIPQHGSLNDLVRRMVLRVIYSTVHLKWHEASQKCNRMHAKQDMREGTVEGHYQIP